MCGGCFHEEEPAVNSGPVFGTDPASMQAEAKEKTSDLLQNPLFLVAAGAILGSMLRGGK